MPDDETTQRIYERATSGRRHLLTKRRLVAVTAVLAVAGIAGGLTATLGSGADKFHPRTATVPAGGPSTGIWLNPLTTDFTASDNEYSAIDVNLLSPTGAPTVNLRVIRSDASDVAETESAMAEVVFDEQVSTTALESDEGQDFTQSTWSGTLTPSEWNGGCQQALYRIEYDFGTDDTWGSSGWFQCSGPAVDPANPFLY